MSETNHTNRRGSGVAIAATAVLCLVLGAAGGMWYMQSQSVNPAAAPATSMAPAIPSSAAVAPPTEQTPLEQIVVSIPSDSIDRMELAFAPVTMEVSRTGVRVPGTVEPNGYRQVPVTPVTGGILTEVTAELGQTVKRGEKMARIFSQELADAQTELIGMDADLEVVHKKMMRTEELVKLGAASVQELEEVQGEHQQHNAHIEQAVQKLILLGMTPEQAAQIRAGSQVSSEITIPAPIDGVVLTRSANLGQVVATGQELFQVTDLSSVWIEGNLLEDDFSKVRVGSQAVITTPADVKAVYRGAVDYIDPRVDPQTRTAKVRVIVPNRNGALRLGMYADMAFTTSSGSRVPVVPVDAVQRIGSNSVVYVPIEGEPNRFEQRTVTIGEETSGGWQVLAGLQPDQRVVTSGSFLLRAEALRQHPQ